MLRELRIQNFAIIDRLDIRFHEQLNVLTGETGAGKSILVDAVDLLLGGRASSDHVRTGCEEAALEAVFEISANGPTVERLTEMDLLSEGTDDLIVRRIISRSGKSRAYVNGRLATVGQLRQLGDLLVDIHGQHEHQSLLRADPQLDMLDAFGNLLDGRDEYHRRYVAYRKIQDERVNLENAERDRSQREDLLRFQAQEIGSAQLSPGEDARLERERAVLADAERLSVLADEAHRQLYAADDAVLGRLAPVESLIKDLARTDERVADLTDQCSAAAAQLREVAERLRDYKEGIVYDPDRLEWIKDRLHAISTLKKKYAPTIEGILGLHQKVQNELADSSTREDRLAFLRGALNEARQKARDLAERLTRERNRAARALEKKVQTELGLLGMERTKFEIRVESLQSLDNLGPIGRDAVDFLIAPNPGEALRPLARIASGGELSRVMLSLKSILSAVDRIPTLIFDEVDAGIGGGVAEVVGQRLKTVARGRQVLCITHLPQIASQADVHFYIEKAELDGRAVTKIKRLENGDRVAEIARMLGGRETTPTAFKHAREMLDLGARQ